MIIITNMIPLYNVWYRGWSSFNLILLFIAEAAIVVLMDSLKSFFMAKDTCQRSNAFRSDRSPLVQKRNRATQSYHSLFPGHA